MKDYVTVILSVLIFCVSVFVIIKKTENNILNVISESDQDYSKIIILDAGHGGEDGGAVAFDGTFEKDINLSVTRKISLLFDIFGIDYIETRNTDTALGDTSLETIRERKVSDISERYRIINSFDNSVLLSIHQNYFQIEKYKGSQVFYSSCEGSEDLAEKIQNRIKNNLQNDNNRVIKESDNSIYLLFNAKRPSVLVECGFISNFEELNMLKNNIYQNKLSYLIMRGLIDYLAFENISDI